MKQRIIGFDIARALAIFGMVLVNFKQVMNANSGDASLLYASSLIEGRASALFVILAGVGLSLLSKEARATQDYYSLNAIRHTVIKRGIVLLVFGLLYTPIWPADILHFYGCYFLIAALTLQLKSKHLLWITSLFIMSFPVLLIAFNYDKGWDWNTLHYLDLWTFEGMIRHLFFNGFHPVFPWCAFLLFGLWLGRQELTLTRVKIKLTSYALVIWLSIEFAVNAIKASLLAELAQGKHVGITTEEVNILFGTAPMPPLPSYMLSAGSLAVVIIVLSVQLGQSLSQSKLLHWLAKTGKLSLSLYIAHVILAMGILEALGYLTKQSIEFAMLTALLFCLSSVIFSVLWLKYFRRGPIEWLFDKATAK